jgi:hypothetical protein
MNEVAWTEDGLGDLIREIRQFAGVPTFRVIRGLELVLRSAFVDTQAKTHVISGSLKASGHSASEYENDEWSGAIGYGGPPVSVPVPASGYSPSATAPKDPVDYAIYEMARGGHHDFFRDLVLFEPLFEQAILAHGEGLG